MATAREVTLTAGVPTSPSGEVSTIDRMLAGAPVTGSTTPAAASHTAGDCWGAAMTFSSVAPEADTIRLITQLVFNINSGTAVTTAYNLYLFTASKASSQADDAAFSMAAADRTLLIGGGPIYIPQPVIMPGTNFQTILIPNLNIEVYMTGTGLEAYLVNTTTATPQAVAHEVVLFSRPIGVV